MQIKKFTALVLVLVLLSLLGLLAGCRSNVETTVSPIASAAALASPQVVVGTPTLFSGASPTLVPTSTLTRRTVTPTASSVRTASPSAGRANFTPTALPTPAVTEIKFPPMTTRYVAGCGETEEIPPNGVRVYRLWLRRGQWIGVLLAYEDLEEEDALQAKITSPAGKQFVLGPSLEWSGRLPQTGLYSISVFSRAQTVKHYALAVDAPVEIPPASLERGFVSRGRIVGACGEGEYLLSLNSPLPKLDIKVQKIEGKGRLVLAVVGLDDNIPYLRAMMGMSEFELSGLPPQKYLIEVVPWASVTNAQISPEETWSFELVAHR